MSGAKEFLQVKFLKTLEPLSSLSVDKLEELANKSQVEELPPGRMVFRQGERDSRCVYLLSGQLELQVTGNPRTETLKAKTTETRYPVAQEWPRPSTCRTKTNTVLLYIDSNLLEILLSNDPSGRYEVTEIGVEEDPENDWMLRFLQSPAFLQLPTDNIQKLLIQLEEASFKAGQTIVTQGDSDEWYYIIKQGKCTVARRPAPKAEEVRLAVLGPGDGFGEEALITHGKRNATVTAKEDTVLMRLNSTDFHKLLVEPLLSLIDHSSMMEKVKAGAALIDVRTNKEFNDNGIKGALNIPLSMLRLKAKDLNSTREHIVYCNDANLSSAAAFLLAQQSLQVFVLKGGLNGQQKTFSPAVSQTASKTSAPPQLNEPAPVPPVLQPIEEEVFKQHRRQAQDQAQRASEAESVHKQAEAKTVQLRQEADALRAQADRLANKTASAEAERQKAENEVRRIREETLKQRDEILANAKVEVAKEKERLKQQAEEARLRAEEELARIKHEADAVNQKQSKLDDEFKRAETEKQQTARAAEVARIMAKQEAEKVKAEAEAIRQQALNEAERLKQEMESRKAKMQAEEAAHHQAAVEEARRKAENAITEAARAAEDARRQAEIEAQTIRKQALEEAERLRLQLEQEKQKAAEAAARAKAEEQLRLQELETVRRKAMDDARRQAELEAENIRNQALEEARSRAQEETRRLVELETASMRQKTFEEVQRQAMETARLQAEQAAESIRREALEEANRLRQEMETTRLLVESEAKRAKDKIEKEATRRQAEEETLAKAAAESARRAAEEAERRRAEDARRRLAEEEQQRAEELRRRQEQEAMRRAAEARRIAQEEEQRRAEEARTQTLAEEQRKQAAHRQQQEQLKVREAEKRAAILKQRMAENNARKQTDELAYAPGNNGPKLSKAKLHIIKDKTILEGEEDIFVFKAPSERPPTRDQAEKLLKEAEAQLKEKKDLPSFDIEYADEAESQAHNNQGEDPQFSDSIVVELDNITAKTGNQPNSPRAAQDIEFSIPEDVRSNHKPRSRRSLIALAASVVVMVAISIIVITRPTYIDKNVLSAWTGDSDQGQPDTKHGLASMHNRGTTDARAVAEDRVKAQANAEFRQLLSQWRKDKNSGSN